jgi:C4-dicarboxylate-specific signal transduction histidine kinase
MKKILKNFLAFYNNLEFKYKTSFLVFIIVGGMIWIIIFSQISIFAIKQDFDILFDTRTKNLIYLEKIKDSYKVNIQDTLKDLNNKEITINQAKEVFLLAEQIINKNWKLYKKNLLQKEDSIFIKKILAPNEKSYENELLANSIINNIDKKLLAIQSNLKKILHENDLSKIKEIHFQINAITIYLTSLINYDLSITVNERRDTQKSFNKIIILSIVAIVMVFLFSILLSILIINNFKNLHNSLEEKVNEKTKELTELNNYLEIKVSKEVAQNRKKDIIMSQQARLASLGEMLNNIAHQWRQPLGSITMIIQSFQTKMELGKLTDSFVEEKVEDALLLANNMSNTLDDFKNFFSPRKTKSIFYISDCIEHSIQLAKYTLEKQNIIIKLEIKDNVELNTYYNELSHVFLNILSNSKDALSATSRKNDKIIKIVVNEFRDTMVINLMDNGGGIDDNIIPKIFEPYYTTKYKSAGTGIGLYMVKQIIEKHMYGSITFKNIQHKIDNKNNYKCSLFTIKIPISENSAHQEI